MAVAVIGTGKIGSTLARAFGAAGLETVLGSRDPGAVADAPVKVVTVAEALAGADTVVLAQPGTAVDEFLAEHGPALDGRLVVDAANRLAAPVQNSAAEVAERAPGARYARAFSSQGVEVFADPLIGGTASDHLFSAAEEDRAAVEELISAVGLRPVYLGPDQYELVDRALWIWFRLAVAQGHGRHSGFRLLTDSDAPGSDARD
ncbi:NAD(P)-binding domain-containing protein [Kitasatospora sp. NPDC049258]|uniref:NADPH-dependent F420 reductase n=1 Tax=Kitasatospora sp. NPDC049258 TaxID=3155394 RepID=UPI00341777A3